MEKVNIFSVFLFNLFRGLSKKYLLFFLMIVAILVYGFLFTSPVYAETHISNGEIIENTTWTKANSPYIIETSIYVHKDITLTIEPGVVVKFKENPDYYSYGYSLDIAGKLIANGTKDPIYFTSNYDDTVGGSTDEDWYSCDYEDYVLDENGDFLKDENGDYILDEEGDILGIGEEICEYIDWYDPEAGDWGGIDFQSSNNSELKNVFFRYADEALSFESSNIEINNLNISDGVSGMTGYNNSSIKIVNGNINNLEGDAFTFFNNSSLDLKNIKIENVLDGFTLFNDSSLDISGGKLTHNGTGFEIFNNVTANISNFEIDGGDIGIEIFNGSTLNLKNSVIKNASYAGLESFSGEDEADNNISISKSEITKNGYGLVLNNSVLSVSQNSIHDNIVGASTWSPDLGFDLKNNFWGDKSGPKNETSNPTGIGNEIADNILFTPFLKYDPTKEVRNPVILIPGITGTYLNRNYGDKDEIWPDILKLISPLDPFDSYLNDLALSIDGTEKSEFPIVPGDIIRGISGVHVFDKLIEEFTNAGYIEGTDLFVFPYDWRLSTKSTADLLKIKIDKILLDTGQDKVDIVAHSMGGLVAKKYIADDEKDKIDQLIFLGTPQLGAPKAFKVLMNGDDMGYKKLFLGLNESRAKYISQNMPSVYELLPSLKYVTENGSYITNALSEIIIPGTSFNLDYLETKDLMIKNGRNPLMFPFTEDLHDSIDDLDLSDMKSYNFVGCGSPTISKITMSQKRSWKKLFLGLVDDYYLKYGDGDETVPLNSSTRTIGSDIYYAVGVSHGSLPAADSVIKGILNILNGEGLNFGDVLKDDSSSCGIEGKVVSTHSPVELHVYDEKGNHTGLKGDGSIEYGIEGVSFDIIEGENYMFLPNDRNFKIVTKATDTGGYNFKIEEQDKNDNITDTYKWNLIPLSTLQTTGEIWVGPDYSPADYAVKIDKDGDGAIDSNYDVAYDGTSNAEKIISESLNKHHSSGYIRLLPYQNINTVEPEQIVNKSDEIVEKQAEVSNFKPESTKEKVIVKNEIKEDKKFEIKEDEKYENNNLASVASTNVKISKNTLLIIIGGFIFVILLAIKFIFKLK